MSGMRKNDFNFLQYFAQQTSTNNKLDSLISFRFIILEATKPCIENLKHKYKKDKLGDVKEEYWWILMNKKLSNREKLIIMPTSFKVIKMTKANKPKKMISTAFLTFKLLSSYGEEFANPQVKKNIW